MPVVEHEVSEKVKIGSDYRYGCHNKPLPEFGQVVRSTFSGEEWPYVFSTECRFDMSLSDPACTGCEHRGSGERYDTMIRSEGK